MAAPWQPAAPGRREERLDFQGRPPTFIPFEPQFVEAQDQYTTYQNEDAFDWAGNTIGTNGQAGAMGNPEQYPQGTFAPPYETADNEVSSWNMDCNPKVQSQTSVSEYNHWETPENGFVNETLSNISATEVSSEQTPTSSLNAQLPPLAGLLYPLQPSNNFANQSFITDRNQLDWPISQYEPRFRERTVPVGWIPYPEQPPSLVHDDSVESWTSSSADQGPGMAASPITGALHPEHSGLVVEKTTMSSVAVSVEELPATPTAPAVPKAAKAQPKENNAIISKRLASFDECVTMFETTPGAMTKVKRRRKLDAESHKSFKVTRRIGACLECRFRKRSCCPGSPCQYCIKVFGSTAIAEVTCQRESPFSGNYCVTDYFLLSSKKRIIDFDIKGREFENLQKTGYFTIRGKSGPCDLTVDIPVAWQSLESLSMEDRSEVWRTKQRPTDNETSNELSRLLIPVIPEDDEALGKRLETWAMTYASTFARDHRQRFPTAHAFHVGVVYVSKKLPEYQLVYQLLRGIALAYILRAGVEVPTTEFRTIQARIDTVIYKRLRQIEMGVFAALQKIVWVSAGRLKREQCYPVAYVLWQTMRSTCLRASHVKTLLDKAKGVNSAEYKESVAHLAHCFNLLLSVHTALFRSNSPIILDYKDPANHDLLNFDKEFIREAAKLRDITLNFHKGSQSRPFRDSNWYHTNMSKRLMRVLSGKGAD